MGRKANENSGYRVSLHKINGYCYASTQPLRFNEKTGKKCYSHIHWGVVDENLKFYPGKNYFYTNEEERSKLVFPARWDLSEISRFYGGAHGFVQHNSESLEVFVKHKTNESFMNDEINIEESLTKEGTVNIDSDDDQSIEEEDILTGTQENVLVCEN